jgi:molybdopterin-containing oxidoreductase family membrane subunit
MQPKKYIMGLFRDEDQVVSTVEALKDSPFELQRVNTPFPNHKILDALKLKKSKVGYFTLIGGILGFFSGLGLAIFCATKWDLIVSGKPVISLIPFFIVGFEFTILFAVFGNLLGLLALGGLPSFKGLTYYDPRCSADHFGILATCGPEQEDGLMDFFRRQGGEVKVFE